MKLRRTHIPEKLLNSRRGRISEEDLLNEVQQIFYRQEAIDEAIINKLTRGNDSGAVNNFNLSLLQRDRIYHISDIERICIDYRLRFLNSALYKADIPYEAVMKIKALEKKHQISIKGFKLMAPASVFKLKNADDPLLFAPIGNEYYYLVHSWGRDLHPLRKLLMWPFRHLENFMFFLLLTSLVLTTLIPTGMFGPENNTTEFFILFFFMFKWVTGLSIFYGFKYGKNFSSAIWRSTFSNA